MAQNSRYGGPSITPEEAADPALPSAMPIRVRRPEVGPMKRAQADTAKPVVVEEDPPSVGNSSKPSTEKPQASDEKPKTTPRKAARTTENRSKAVDTETDSSAHTTDGDGRSNASKPSDDVDFDI